VPLRTRLHLRLDLSAPVYGLTLVTEQGERVRWQAAGRMGLAAGGYF
jgi:hypothetical protein